MSSGRKSLNAILFEGRPQNNPDVHDFLRCADTPGRRPEIAVVPTLSDRAGLSPTELASTGRCSARRTARALVLVPEDQASLFEIVGGHLDRDAIAGQRLDPVLFHL